MAPARVPPLGARNTTDGAAPLRRPLDDDLADAEDRARDVEIPPAAVALGASELIEEVSAGQDHRRGGPLLEDRPLGLRRQRRGRREGHRACSPRRSRRPTPTCCSASRPASPRSRQPRAAAAGRRLGALLPGERRVPFAAVHADDRDPGADRHDEGPAREPLGGPGARAGSARPVVSRGGISRRAFLAGAGGGGGGRRPPGRRACGGGSDDGPGAAGAACVAFAGPHQAGITLAAGARGRADGLLRGAGRATAPSSPACCATSPTRSPGSWRGARPRSATAPTRRPTPGSSGRDPPPDDLTVVVERRRVPVRRALRPGATAGRASSWTMPFLANDRLDPARTHGDLLLSIEAAAPRHRACSRCAS